jgi:hypothetical protein
MGKKIIRKESERRAKRNSKKLTQKENMKEVNQMYDKSPLSYSNHHLLIYILNYTLTITLVSMDYVIFIYCYESDYE